MQSHSGDAGDYHPTGRDLDEFKKWLRAPDSSQTHADHFGNQLLAIYREWLRARRREVAGWIPDFLTSGQSGLLKALLRIQKELTGLYVQLDRLYGARSYLAASSLQVTAAQQKLFDDDFIDIYVKLRGVLNEYVIYANALEARFNAHELLDTSPMSRQPAELEQALIRGLRVVEDVLSHLAEELGESRGGSSSPAPAPGGSRRRVRGTGDGPLPQDRLRGA